MRRLIKKQITLFVVIIILMLLSIVSSSYALFKKETKATEIEHSTNYFNVNYSSSSPALSGDIYALTSEEALASPDYTITVSMPDNVFGADYKIEVFENPPQDFAGDLVDLQYIWVAVDGNVVNLGEATTNVIDNVTYYLITTDHVNSSSSKNHYINVWLDYDTPNTEAGKYVYLELKVSGEAVVE